jgi:hypothetical protein
MGHALTRQRLLEAHDVLRELYNARAAAGHSRAELESLADAALVALQEYEHFCDLEERRPALKPLAKVVRLAPVIARVYRGKR